MVLAEKKLVNSEDLIISGSLAQDFCSYSRRRNRRIACYATDSTTWKTDKKTSQDADSIKSSLLNVTDQYLTFTVSGERYGMEISHIMEVRSWQPLEVLAEPIDGFKGKINLRGKQVPVVDLRPSLNKETISYDQHSIIIIFNILADQTKFVLGLLGDAVLEVKGITRSAVELAQEIGENKPEWLTSINESGEKTMHLLALDRLINPATLKQWHCFKI